jgi:hypothetical protein
MISLLEMESGNDHSFMRVAEILRCNCNYTRASDGARTVVGERVVVERQPEVPVGSTDLGPLP